MGINFDQDRWQQVKKTYREWWNGELQRPIIPVILHGRDAGRPEPDIPLLSPANCTDLSIPAEQLIDRIDYELSTQVYMGDSFPCFDMDCFGPGVIAAFMGAILDNSTGNVWFRPAKELPIKEIHFRFDPNNIWFRRVQEIYVAGMKRWQGQVLMAMTDLGGSLDILSTFRPSEKLLLDLYDYPHEVKRLLWEAHEVWHKYYQTLNSVLQPTNPGYSDWSGIYSEEPSYMLQCDFSYMIGPEMFDEFVNPELVASCTRLHHSFYHLDGKGQLPHLNSVLSIPNLDGVQWVPGAGNPNDSHWPGVYQKIVSAKKKIQLFGGFDVLDKVINQIGTSKEIQLGGTSGKNEMEIRRKLQKYGIE